MQPRLRVNHGQGSQRVPGSVPDDLFPSLALDIRRAEDLESSLAGFEQRRKCRQAFLFVTAALRRVCIQSNLEIFGLRMLYRPGLDLCCAYPCLRS